LQALGEAGLLTVKRLARHLAQDSFEAMPQSLLEELRASVADSPPSGYHYCLRTYRNNDARR
jgi:hypothetical protein